MTDSGLAALGIAPGDRVRFRRGGARWKEGVVERREKDGSVGLRDAKGSSRSIPVEQLEALDGICRRDGISRAEAIRQAVTLLMRQRGAGQSGMAFGIWRGKRQVDGLKYQERLRREWGSRAAARKR